MTRVILMRLVLPGLMLALWCQGQTASPVHLNCGGTNNTSASPRYAGSRGNAAPGNVSKLPIRSLLYSGSQTRIFARYMPWFGDRHHREVGYQSDDEQQVARQVDDMMSRGIQGAIVDWYGPDSGAKNKSTILLMKEAERRNFEFAVSEDAGALSECQKRGCDVTEQLISDLRYAAEHFEESPSYIRFESRPAVFFFGLEKSPIDWRRVRESVPGNPLFFFRNSGAFANPDSDGGYAWIAPETAGAGDPMAMKYLDRFYSKAQGSNKIAIGSAYKGFDDAEASWGKGHVIEQRCGQTWLATLGEAGHFYSSKHQLPALIIPTWNDYEEGTEIETGIENCVSVQASLADDRLAWTVSGSENTIDHFAVLAQTGREWVEAVDLPAGSHSVKMSELQSREEPAAFCVEAVGKASMLNHFSQAIRNSGRSAEIRGTDFLFFGAVDNEAGLGTESSQQSGNDAFPFHIERVPAHRLSGAAVPVSGVSLIALFAMEVGVNPGTFRSLVLLSGFVRSFPIVLGIPPQTGEGMREPVRQSVGLE